MDLNYVPLLFVVFTLGVGFFWIRLDQFGLEKTSTKNKLNLSITTFHKFCKKWFFYVAHPLLLAIYYLIIGWMGNVFDVLLLISIISIIVNLFLNLTQEIPLVHYDKHIVYSRERWSLALPYWYSTLAASATIIFFTIDQKILIG